MSLTLTESIDEIKSSTEKLEAITNECKMMSEFSLSEYQVPFEVQFLPLALIEAAMNAVRDLGMQADINENRIQSILFDTTTGFLVTGMLQQPLFLAEFDNTHYLVSGRHRGSALLKLVKHFGLSIDTNINCVVFKVKSMELAMQLVLTSNGSRSVSKGENSSYNLAKYGVLPDANDCISAGRNGTITQSEAYINASWFSYKSQDVGDRTISTVHSIAKSFYSTLKKMHYSYEQIVSELDDMLYAIEECSKIKGITNIARDSKTVTENIIETLGLLPKESVAKKQAKQAVKSTLFSRKF